MGQTREDVYTLAEIAESELRARNEHLLENHQKIPRHFTQAELIEYLQISKKTVNRYVEKLKFDPTKYEGAKWLVNIKEAYSIREAIRAEGKIKIPKFVRSPKQKLQVFCVANQKGGVGKTITTATLAACLAVQRPDGFRIGVIDTDPQGTLSMYFAPDRAHADYEGRFSFGDLLLGDYELEEGETLGDLVSNSFQQTTIPNLRILMASERDRQLEGKINNRIFTRAWDNPYSRLHDLIESVKDEFDIIFIDTPPSMTYQVYNSLYAATSLIIPVTPAENDRDATLHWLTNLPVIYETMMSAGMKDYDNPIKLLVTNHNGKQTAQHIQSMLNRAFGSYVFGEAMKHSEPVSRCGASMCTVFCQSKSEYDGHKASFAAAVMNIESVSEQVLKLARDVWERQERE